MDGNSNATCAARGGCMVRSWYPKIATAKIRIGIDPKRIFLSTPFEVDLPLDWVFLLGVSSPLLVGLRRCFRALRVLLPVAWIGSSGEDATSGFEPFSASSDASVIEKRVCCVSLSACADSVSAIDESIAEPLVGLADDEEDSASREVCESWIGALDVSPFTSGGVPVNLVLMVSSLWQATLI